MSGVNRDPITAAAFSVRLAAGSRRSMRAAITACNVRGHVNVGERIRAQVTPRPPTSTSRSVRSRTISSAKKGFPPRARR